MIMKTYDFLNESDLFNIFAISGVSACFCVVEFTYQNVNVNRENQVFFLKCKQEWHDHIRYNVILQQNNGDEPNTKLVQI